MAVKIRLLRVNLLPSAHSCRVPAETFTPQTVATATDRLKSPFSLVIIIWQPWRPTDSRAAWKGIKLSAGRYLIVCLLSGQFVFTEWPRVSPLSLFSLPLLQACAHRWKNVYYDSEHILPHGYCSIIPPSLQGRTKPLIPCYEGTVKAPPWTVTAHGANTRINERRKTPEFFIELPQLKSANGYQISGFVERRDASEVVSLMISWTVVCQFDFVYWTFLGRIDNTTLQRCIFHQLLA